MSRRVDRTELEHDFLDHAKAFEWNTIKTLLDETPDLINVQPAGRWSVLHQACFAGDAAMTKFLLSHGANREATTAMDKTPLTVAKNAEVKAALNEAAPPPAASDDAAAVGIAAAVEAIAAAEAAGEDPPMKKARKAKKEVVYTMNINNAVDKDYEGSSLKQIAEAPTSALQGISDKGKEVLRKFGVKTVKDLANWKFYKMAKGIAGLAELEQEERREEAAALNINKGLDKKHEVKSLKEIVKLPPSALQGLAGWADADLATLHLTTIGKLGEWKFARWAEWISDLAELESEDFSS